MSDLDLSAVRDGHLAADSAPADVSGARPLRPLDRLTLLCDEGSLRLIRPEVTSEAMGDRVQAGDGVVAGAGRIGGRPVYCYAQDASYVGGSLGRAQADTILRVQAAARRAKAPVIAFVASGGARMQEGLAALDGYARIFRQHVTMSGEVPQISVIAGTSAGGGSYSPALTDFVVMVEGSSMFLTGPGVVREVTGEDVSAQTLGGTRVHERNGVCHFTVSSDVDSIFLLRKLLGYLPQSACTAPAPPALPAPPAGPDPGGVVPLDPRRAYDARDAICGIVDADSLLEVSAAWAPNLVTALARIEGRAVGVVANQPKHLGGVIDADASQKGARFVRTCNAFGLALVVLVDTPGFLPGSEQEAGGVIRHGAKLLHAFAEATVPRLTVVLRKAFGGAYITMNSKDLGADLVLAWSRAELGIMGAEQAVGVIHRRELAAAQDAGATRRRLAAAYASDHLTAEGAARCGAVDAVIRPSETRDRLAWALATLPAVAPEPRIRNIPL
jgi:acetyl-CoA carboxylase carboxyltransferase component